MIAALLLQAAAQLPPTPPAGPGRPQTPPTMVVEPVAMAIAAWDADGDARTTRAEMDAGLRRSFASIAGTAASIGYIGWSDWAERWLGDRNALPSPFDVDADGDNRITLAEVQAALAKTFDRLDRNKDGALARSELLTIRAAIGGTGDRRRGKRGGGDQPDGQPPR